MTALEPGRSFGPFVIESLLGRGGMGEVYAALDTRLGRRVALKVIRAAPGANDDAEARGRLVREARAAAGLSHPNVVTIFEVGEVEGSPFIAMELLQGQSLRRVLSTNVPLAQRLAWTLEIARAIEAAHAAGLVHRDVKPANIFLAGDRVKVLDFGIAKRIGTSSASRSAGAPPSFRTHTGHIVGTPGYMAPEQRYGEIDEKVDQFAWGIVAYEILSGTHPRQHSPMFSEETDFAIRPVTLAEIVPDLPFGVSAVVMKALSTWPGNRFSSMREAANALQQVLSSGSSRDDETGRTLSQRAMTTRESELRSEPLAPRPRSYRAIFSLAVLPFALIAIGAGAAFVIPSLLNRTPLSRDAGPSTSIAPPRVAPLSVDASPVIDDRATHAAADAATIVEPPPPSKPRNPPAPRLAAETGDECRCILGSKGAGMVVLCPRHALRPSRCVCYANGSSSVALCPVVWSAGTGGTLSCPATTSGDVKVYPGTEARSCTGYDTEMHLTAGKLRNCSDCAEVLTYAGADGQACEGYENGTVRRGQLDCSMRRR